MSSIFNHQSDDASTVIVKSGSHPFGTPAGSETTLQKSIIQIDPSALERFPYISLATEDNKGGFEYATIPETYGLTSETVMLTPYSLNGYIQHTEPLVNDYLTLIELSTDPMVISETNDLTAITPKKLNTFIQNRYANETTNGVGTYASVDEAKAATNDTKVMTAYDTIVSIVYHSLSGYEDSTESTSGVLRIATKFEVNRDIENLAMTPSNLQFKLPMVSTRGLVSVIANTEPTEPNAYGFSPATIQNAIATKQNLGFVKLENSFTDSEPDSALTANLGKFLQDDRIGISGGVANDLAITSMSTDVTELRKIPLASGNWIYREVSGKVDIISDGVVTNHGVLEAYPVGSYFYTTTNDDPAVMYGGSWSKLQGMTMVGSGQHTDFNNKNMGFGAGQRGGEYRNRLIENNLPSHKHLGWGQNQYWEFGHSRSGGHIGSNKVDGRNYYYYNSPVGGDQPHNNTQPYVVVNIWHRDK